MYSPDERSLPRPIDLSTIRLVHAMKADVQPDRGKGALDPRTARLPGGEGEEQIEPLSEILKLLNERFGTDFADADKEFLNSLEQKLDADSGMAASFAVNTRENARLTFEHKVRDHVQDLIDTNFKFFKQINDKPQFAQFLNDLLFDRYAERKGAEESGRL
jgi:type I restriction enzyme R subunit